MWPILGEIPTCVASPMITNKGRLPTLLVPVASELMAVEKLRGITSLLMAKNNPNC